MTVYHNHVRTMEHVTTLWMTTNVTVLLDLKDLTVKIVRKMFHIVVTFSMFVSVCQTIIVNIIGANWNCRALFLLFMRVKETCIVKFSFPVVKGLDLRVKKIPQMVSNSWYIKKAFWIVHTYNISLGNLFFF